MDKPPVIAAQPTGRKSVKSAWMLNLMCPGAGQLVQGQIALGLIIIAAFLLDFGAMMTLFVKDFLQYLSLATDGNILREGQLEQVGNVYHVKILMTLLVLGIVICIISLATLGRKEPKPQI